MSIENDSMSALFSGLMGTPKATGESVRDEVGQKKNSGETRQSKEKVHEERFCTIANRDALRKIRIIAAREHLQIKEVVNAAFVLAISLYEKKHGVLIGDIKGNPNSLFN